MGTVSKVLSVQSRRKSKTKKKIKEASKVANKLITSELEPDHRKKIVSPKYGVWIGECCKQNLLHICLLDYGVSEELGSEFLRRSKQLS